MTLKNKIITLLLLAMGISSVATHANNHQHQIDSLRFEILNTSNDSVRIDNYRRISRLYRATDFDSALYFANKSLDLAKEKNHKKAEAHAYFERALVYYFKENFEKSLENYLPALEIYLQRNDSTNISAVYLNIGTIYILMFDHNTGIEYYIKSLEISKLMNDSLNLASNLNNLGLIYRDLKNYDMAIRYLNQTLEIDLKSGMEEYIAQTYSNLARTYLPAKDYKNTFKNLEEAYKRIDLVKETDVKIEILSCAGEYYLEVHKPDSAIRYIREAMAVAKQDNRKRTLAYTYFLQGRYYCSQDSYPQAKTNFKKAIRLSDQLNVQEYTADFYEYLSKADLKTNDYKNAHLNLQKANAVREAIHVEELSKSMGNFEKQSEMLRVQAEFQIEQQKKQSEVEKGELRLRLVSQFSILVIIFLITLTVIMINNYRNKSRANRNLKEKNEIIEHQSEVLKSTIDNLEENEEKLKDLNATKDKFFSIIAHDLKNPFNVLLGYSELLAHEPSIRNDSQKLNKIAETMYKTTEFSYELLENLLTWSRSQTEGLKVSPEYFNLSELINSKLDFFTNLAASKNIKIDFDLQPELIVYADPNMILTSLRNLIHNAVKFTASGGKIDVITTLDCDTMKFSVRDTGIGINRTDQKKLFRIDSDFKINGTNQESGTGLGLILSNEFIHKNGGEISVESEEGKGSIFTFTLPILATDE